MKLLILGGTTEASRLAKAFAGRIDVAPVLSLAGRTENPVPPPIPFRVGGFGGVDGLVDYLRREKIAAVIDATHPFAAQMSAHAALACGELNLPLVVYTRPAWTNEAGDDWIEVPDMAAAVTALGEEPRRVFLTQGRLQLQEFAHAPQHTYIVRAIDAPDMSAFPHHRLILARGPFELADEIALMREEKIEIIVTKNSGGSATHAKIEAARQLGLRVVIVKRPPGNGIAELYDLAKILGWIESHRPAP
jgi:precorrin-6A/cobalt-precorrin-6A reductase